ncbi:MAG: hypothetical protein PHU65_00520 [Actinomycetota bacterium]|jgi:hypothetical protein|nr:hypothetical protein [Actinomycetota bacterium]
MSKISKFLKIAKDITVKPGENLEEKIIERIENLKDEEKEMLDEGFLDFLKKENSKIHLFGRRVKQNKGLIIFFSIFSSAVTAFLVIEYMNYKKQK